MSQIPRPKLGKPLTLPINYVTSHWSIRKRAREQYILEQNNKCAHCGGDLDKNPPAKIQNKYLNLRLFPKGFLQNPIHLHHCHKTDMTIGAVHAKCNGVLWQYYGE